MSRLPPARFSRQTSAIQPSYGELQKLEHQVVQTVAVELILEKAAVNQDARASWNVGDVLEGRGYRGGGRE